jgi:predicted component of type VI protein secretion system
MNPQVIDLDLRASNLDSLIRDIRVSQEKKQQVAQHVRQAIARFEG